MNAPDSAADQPATPPTTRAEVAKAEAPKESAPKDAVKPAADAKAAPKSEVAAPAARLRELTAGLLFLSESEAPLTVVELPKDAIMPDALRELAKLPADAPAEEWQVTDLLEPFSTAPEGADEATVKDAARFRSLLDFLTKDVQRTVGYKLGAGPKKPLFFIGRLPKTRAWLGLQTEVVET